jgi:hypothetical protein
MMAHVGEVIGGPRYRVLGMVSTAVWRMVKQLG